jgi:bifunctional enzyme CysN/CysC
MSSITQLQPLGIEICHTPVRGKTGARVIVCGAKDSGKSALIDCLKESVISVIDDAQIGSGLVTDICNSNLAVVVVDAETGISSQTRRCCYVLSLFRIRDVVLVVNKMDRVGYSEKVFAGIENGLRELMQHMELDAVGVIPLSALHGVNVHGNSPNTSWYRGPSLIQHFNAAVGEKEGSVQPSHVAANDLQVADQFQATLIWLSEEPMLQGRTYRMNIGAKSVLATIAPLKYRINTDTLDRDPAEKLESGDVGVAEIELNHPISFHPFKESRDHGSFIVRDRVTNQIVGLGLLDFALRRAANVHWQALDVTKDVRARQKGQRPCVLWFTGLSGAGKSTIANLVEKRLLWLDRHTYLLDGDNVRHGLNKDLGFTAQDRVENIRRVAEVAKLMADAGLIVLASFISPFRTERRMVRELMDPGEFVEVFVDAPLDVVERRDPKGLYRKARRGELRNFTGIDSPYEIPEQPEVRIDTTAVSADDAADRIIDRLVELGLLENRRVAP